MKRILLSLIALASLFAVSCASNKAAAPAAAEKAASISAQVTALTNIDKYGDLTLTATTRDLRAAGFEYADMLAVSFNGQTVTVPMIPHYRYVASKGSALVAFTEEEKAIQLEIFNGSFAATYGLADKTVNEDKTFFWTAREGVAFPLDVTITLAQKQGYYKEYLVFDLHRTNSRADYTALTDEQFANFREVTTSGMGEKKLYRSSSPVNPEIGRNTFADAAAKAAGVHTFLNLADDEKSAQKYAGFAESYYASQNVIFLGLGVDFSTQNNRDGLCDGLRALLKKPAPYLVHCTEGQDRAGFVSAVLECLMGASFDEVKADYMTTFENYYGVKKGSDQYAAISENIVKGLSVAFGTKDLAKADLAALAAKYLQEIGLSADEVSALKAKLGK